MSTRHVAKEYRMANWAQIISEQKESGLTIRAFCKESGLHENCYYYWQKKLRLAAIDELSATNDEREQKLAPVMARIDLPKTIGLEVTDIGSDGCVSIEMFGIKLLANKDYPISKLSELLRVASRL